MLYYRTLDNSVGSIKLDDDIKKSFIKFLDIKNAKEIPIGDKIFTKVNIKYAFNIKYFL